MHFCATPSLERKKNECQQGVQIWPLWQNLKSLWPILMVCWSIEQNFEPTLAYYVCYWANLHFCKCPNTEQIILPSGHTECVYCPRRSFTNILVAISALHLMHLRPSVRLFCTSRCLHISPFLPAFVHLQSFYFKVSPFLIGK